jgi:type IV pilus assembly protein PilA
MKIMKMRKGFTLVELLIVLAVIAALMSVATPTAINAVNKANGSAVAQNLQNLVSAGISYVSTEQPDDVTSTTDWVDIKSNLISDNYIQNLNNAGDYTVAASSTSGSSIIQIKAGYNSDSNYKYIEQTLPAATTTGATTPDEVI